MGISLIPTYPARWYTRTNTATSLMSLSIALYFGVYEFVLTSETDTSGTDLVLAILAAMHALYGLTLYFVLATHHPKIAGFVSYLLFFMASAYSFWITKDMSNTYFALFAIAGLLSGLYGWLAAIVFNASGLTMLVLLQTQTVSSNENFTTLQLVMYGAVSVMSILIWSAGAGNPKDDELAVPMKKKKRKSSDENEVVDTNVLVNSITDGVAIIDARGIIQTLNPSAQTITGWSADEAIGLDHRSVLVLADQKDALYIDAQNPIAQSLTSGEATKDPDVKLQTKSKKMIEVDLLASPIKDGSSKSEATVVIFRDVSKQRIEERQRAEFISTASHEMRTPVAAIEGYLALAMNDKVAKIDSSAKSYLEKAHASTQHLGKLFQDLLTAAKSEDGRLTNNPEIVEMGQLLDELIEGVRFTAEKKGLLMESDFGGMKSNDATINTTSSNTIRPIAYVHLDPERIREVITNLFDNAVKYTDEGKVTIGMKLDDKNVIVTVSDTGAGIPKEDIGHLFQKFYRVDNTATRQVGGTGLGLFICKKIVELYNGRIWAESVVGEGSTFSISLPRVSSQKAQEMLRTQETIKNSQNASQQAAPPTQPAIAPSNPAASTPATPPMQTTAPALAPAPAAPTPPPAPEQPAPPAMTIANAPSPPPINEAPQAPQQQPPTKPPASL